VSAQRRFRRLKRWPKGKYTAPSRDFTAVDTPLVHALTFVRMITAGAHWQDDDKDGVFSLTTGARLSERLEREEPDDLLKMMHAIRIAIFEQMVAEMTAEIPEVIGATGARFLAAARTALHGPVDRLRALTLLSYEFERVSLPPMCASFSAKGEHQA